MLYDTVGLSKYHCWAWNRIYVKSNGRVPCWCDSGEPHTILKYDYLKNDFVIDILNSPQMRDMRLTIMQSNSLYIPECASCCCLLTQGEPKNKRYKDSPIEMTATNKSLKALRDLNRVSLQRRSWPHGSIDTIQEMQIEPSFPCNLRCVGCLHGILSDPLSTEEMPFIMPYQMFTNIIDSINDHAVRLQRIAFVGRGEPTLNKRFGDIVSYARANIPDVIMGMDTNSTQQFKDDYLQLSWINCSIDGSEKEAYDTYRRKGDFHAALSFMAQAATAKKRLQRSCKIRWKYILFNTTEDIALLDKAQKIALELDIDELNFIITDHAASDGSVLPPQVMNNIQIVNNYIINHQIFPRTLVSRAT
jgi:hypothetical protein